VHNPQLLFVGLGAILIVVGLPLARRNVPPNRWYGVRIRATFADPEVWYEANATAGRDMIRLGIAVMVLSIVIPWIAPLRDSDYAGVLAAVVGVGALGFTIRSVRLANRLLRERRGG